MELVEVDEVLTDKSAQAIAHLPTNDFFSQVINSGLQLETPNLNLSRYDTF